MKRILIQFHSKVSRRIFVTVLLCSLLPISTLVGLTYYNVQTKVFRDTNRGLHSAGKNAGMAIMSKLNSLEQNLRNEAILRDFATSENVVIEKYNPNSSGNGFLANWFFLDRLAGANGLPPLTQTIRKRLDSGLPHLDVIRNEQQEMSLFLWVPVRDQKGAKGVAVGKIDVDALWAYTEEFLPPNTWFSIFNEKNQLLFQNLNQSAISPPVLQRLQEEKTKYHETNIDGQDYLIGNWNLFLLAGFNSSSWVVVVGVQKSFAFSSIYSFQKNAGLIGITAFWVILLASSILIRKTLQPLQQLKEATQQVGQGKFDFHIESDSQDEFGLLSTSFNSMVDKIQRQITRQKQMGVAVREVLSAGEDEEVIQSFFSGLAQITTMKIARLVIFKYNQPDNSMIGSSWTCQLQESTNIEIDWGTKILSNEIEVLIKNQELFIYALPTDFPCLLNPLATFNSQHHLLFHIHINQKMKAILVLADSLHIDAEEPISNVRQLSDQLGVSLSRAATVHELDDLNIGVLTALARTVDANSKWTHGHSERVTEYALIIAKELGFSETECNDLHHAGLLHDLGKVSIPAEILNKPGKLTDEEYSLMKAHPTEGERIIEPINAFKTICPVVRQHHERWDGKGYPDGLKGEAIHFGARVLAVADVYDALYSDRPYREGWPLEKVVDYLKQESGGAFDPLVVKALMRSLHKLDSCAAKHT